jgi:asparagine synthetase B (glutamine-hydrolysing)
MSMAVSLECRVPLLDHELVEMAARIPARHKVKDGRLKHLMKAALADIARRHPAPRQAWLRHAHGRLAQEGVAGRGARTALAETVRAPRPVQAGRRQCPAGRPRGATAAMAPTPCWR